MHQDHAAAEIKRFTYFHATKRFVLYDADNTYRLPPQRCCRCRSNSFTFFSPLGCSNSPITFTNTSDPGQDPTTLNCINPNAKYTWLVDGTAQLSNVPISTLFTYTFTPGTHSVTLHLNARLPGACPAADVTQTICIQGPPTPAFTLPVGPVCLSSPVTVTDNSVVDPGSAEEL